MTQKYVYLFSEGNGNMRELLGGKGANLAEMTGLGMPVPQGFTVTTEACTRYYDDGETISEEIWTEILHYVSIAEELNGKKFGDPLNPLLVSVRSGSRASMPGMMDTILNLGLNDDVVSGLSALTGNERFAYDSYRRFIQMFSDVVMGLPKSAFEEIIDEHKKARGINGDLELTADDMKHLTREFKQFYRQHMHEEFPADPLLQLREAVKAVFRSWNNPRAVTYRRMNDIPSDWGTAVNVQAMVFGNMGETSGTGVAFTRNPATGEKKLFGEFLMNAQGEDVVAGIRTPKPISSLQQVMPNVYKQFTEIADKLEKHYHDMQDMEFTIENGKLYMLQTRNGKRTAAAALKIAIDLVDEGLLTVDEALMKVEPRQLDSMLHPQFEPSVINSLSPDACGLNASPGAACGRVYFTAVDAKAAVKGRGDRVVLVRLETSPEDIDGMVAAQGVLTARGGMTSHAAVVARGMGKCCVSGCTSLEIDEKNRCCRIGSKTVMEGEIISIDGTTGNIYVGEVPTVEASPTKELSQFMKWADERRTMGIRANADTPRDAAQALKFGAEGIGLCRTEHMFFAPDRIRAMREMILADTTESRKAALEKLLPMQRGDFEEIFIAMKGLPVTIRFLDPPLHEFLPNDEKEIETLAAELKTDTSTIKAKISALHEFNPMMGHRGCRLSISYPEIAEMQTKAVIQAAINVNSRGVKVVPEIMIPLVGDIRELQFVKKIVTKTADSVIADAGVPIKYLVGTMIEIPRAALCADEMATEADFFSFGTNDLTQLTYGFSRDDAGKFLESYYKNGIFESEPFAKLDTHGVGRLVRMAAELGRKTRPDIKLGICGEHGGDPSSIRFCHEIGLNYVSCSPYRVPIARLAAAQASICSSETNRQR